MTVKIDSELAQDALEAKRLMIEVGEGVVCDELIMRAVVAYDILERHGMIAAPGEDDVRLGMVAINRAHAIALIAHNFEDYPPSTPHRERLFAHTIGAERAT